MFRVEAQAIYIHLLISIFCDSYNECSCACITQSCGIHFWNSVVHTEVLCVHCVSATAFAHCYISALFSDMTGWDSNPSCFLTTGILDWTEPQIFFSPSLIIKRPQPAVQSLKWSCVLVINIGKVFVFCICSSLHFASYSSKYPHYDCKLIYKPCGGMWASVFCSGLLVLC